MVAEPCKYGHFSERGAQNKCLECARNHTKKFRVNNPGSVKAKNRTYLKNNPAQILLQKARDRARKGGYACTITIADIAIPEFCPLLGIKLSRGTGIGGALPSSPSLDKIRPGLGYIPGNVWVISKRANRIKNDATVAELELLVVNLKKRCAEQPSAIELPKSGPWG